jgi:hypothetical protein
VTVKTHGPLVELVGHSMYILKMTVLIFKFIGDRTDVAYLQNI